MEVLVIVIVYSVVLLISVGASSITRVKESERIVVFRRGRFIRIAGPGLVLIIPGNVTVLRIKLTDLNKEVPGWQGLPKDQLDKRTKRLILALPKKRGINEYSWRDYCCATISGKVLKKNVQRKRPNWRLILAAGFAGAAWGDDSYHISLNSSTDVFRVSSDDYNRIREGDLITITYDPESAVVVSIELGDDSAHMAKDLEALAQLYKAQGKNVEAARLRKKVLEKREKSKKRQRQ
jgi:hypothetical protein